ncbi:uncharacterized protein LOC6578146 isoform X2 [Drosophila mojavensis]|uniref:uncharacterized protein LOC6578146 isoform X2 n=1 Tax=Drosophila mojavensis TaxID=7230 RepID=UPI001CD0BEF7|nr:uncharacterized protein LOC6578146 isoform X2 [Drosophila mojavensis]
MSTQNVVGMLQAFEGSYFQILNGLKPRIWWTVQTLTRKLLLGANSLETQKLLIATHF